MGLAVSEGGKLSYHFLIPSTGSRAVPTLHRIACFLDSPFPSRSQFKHLRKLSTSESQIGLRDISTRDRGRRQIA